MKEPARRLRAVESIGGEPSGPALELERVGKSFASDGRITVALEDINLRVEPREFVCLVGASGCGKSTLLNVVAGLDPPTTGRVRRFATRPALIFQEAALFPWLDVVENVAFPLQVAGVPRRQRTERAQELLRVVRLQEFARYRPHELSGGMRQRVALARALAQDATMLLMDEPFAALDALMRDHLHDELEALEHEAGLSILFVTHNVREAVRLADRVLLLSSRPGRIVAEYKVSLPRPRRIESAEVAELARTILDRFREESGDVE